MNNLLINLHIPKTGGTTLRDIIYRQYPINNIITTPTLNESKSIINNLSLNKLKQLDIIQGHLQYGIHENLNRNIKYITIIRDPVKRVLSTYYYILNQENNPHNLSTDNKQMTIYDYIKSGINPFLINNNYLNDLEICRSYNLGNYGDFIDYDYGTNGIDHEAQLYQGLNPECCVIDSLESASLIISGENLLAIQVHNVSSSSSDMSSNFFLSFGIEDESSFYGETPEWFQEPVTFDQSNLPIFIIFKQK